MPAISGEGLAGTSRRGGAGVSGACCSPGVWRRNPPGPTERSTGCGAAGACGAGAGSSNSSSSASSATIASGSGSTAAIGSGSGSGSIIGSGAATISATGSGSGAATTAAGSFGLTGDGRACSSSRCALPITALRLTPPSASAI